MKIEVTRTGILTMFLLSAAVLCQAVFAAQSSGPDLEALAKGLTQQLAARQFDAVLTHFDKTMTLAMPASKLAEFWDGLVGRTGTFQSIDNTHIEETQGHQIVLVTTKFEKATLDFKWVFDAKEHVAGFFVLPVHAAASSWTPPGYAIPRSFHEQSVSVGEAPWKLSGTLTLPNCAGPFPAVVLVAGSGPEDQDETILSNKPFKDIAWGLASRNIAVLRYDKRTLEYGPEIQARSTGFTVNEETVDDARAAVALLSKRPEIDPRQIFVLGHSLGGTLAPRIAQGDPQVAGLIILAGSTLPLERVVVNQLEYVAGLRRKITPEAQKQIDNAKRFAREVESPTLAADTTLTLLGSPIPGSYFLNLRDYHPVEVAAQFKIPMLILRGDRDYQVTQEDFDGWTKGLSGRPGITFKVYPGLYHLFMPSSSTGAGLGTPADYQKPGHVMLPVIEDIAGWIKTQEVEAIHEDPAVQTPEKNLATGWPKEKRY